MDQGCAPYERERASPPQDSGLALIMQHDWSLQRPRGHWGHHRDEGLQREGFDIRPRVGPFN